MGTVVLRPMRWWDVMQLMPLERELFGPTAWTPEGYWSQLAQPDSWFVVADDADGSGDGDAGLIGYAGVVLGGAEAEVATIAVAPAAQGRGLGRMLLDALVARARQAGATSLLLEVRADNPSAIQLYERTGFVRIAVRRNYYQPPGVDAIVMRLRPLPSAVSPADAPAGGPA